MTLFVLDGIVRAHINAESEVIAVVAMMSVLEKLVHPPNTFHGTAIDQGGLPQRYLVDCREVDVGEVTEL